MRSAEQMAQFLGAQLGASVRVKVGRSRTQPVRARSLRPLPFAKGGVELVVHQIFLDAPDHVLVDMAQWLKVGRRAKVACERMDRWMNQSLSALPPAKPRAIALRPQGLHHHLTEIQAELLAGEFQGCFPIERGPELPQLAVPQITWGRNAQPAKRKTKQRTMRLGSYAAESNLIRIHPRLDQKSVPMRFVRYIVFHEMLHALYPSSKDVGGRWVHHTRAFRERERRFPDYAYAIDWEETQLFKAI